MKFDLTAPCGNCPFRVDKPFYLDPARTAEILHEITDGQKTFACHKTVDYSHDADEGEGRHHKNTQHCAGALIMLEKIKLPNQMMRIAERLGLYDHTQLRMESPVYDTPRAMINAMKKLERKNA